MFDDPRRELNRLQRELLAEEEENEAEYETEYEDDDLADILEMLRRDEPAAPREETSQPIYRNYANNYGRREPAQPRWDDWEEDDRMAYAGEEDADDRTLYREPPRRVRREKGIRGLVILACLELLGILLILGWWMLWMV